MKCTNACLPGAFDVKRTVINKNTFIVSPLNAFQQLFERGRFPFSPAGFKRINSLPKDLQMRMQLMDVLHPFLRVIRQKNQIVMRRELLQ